MALQPGATLGPYEILSLIGAGGMGEVYARAIRASTRDIALKILAADLSADGESNLADSNRRRERPLALEPSRIFSAFTIWVTENGVFYLASELCPRRDAVDR